MACIRGVHMKMEALQWREEACMGKFSGECNAKIERLYIWHIFVFDVRLTEWRGNMQREKQFQKKHEHRRDHWLPPEPHDCQLILFSDLIDVACGCWYSFVLSYEYTLYCSIAQCSYNISMMTFAMVNMNRYTAQRSIGVNTTIPSHRSALHSSPNFFLNFLSQFLLSSHFDTTHHTILRCAHHKQTSTAILN